MSWKPLARVQQRSCRRFLPISEITSTPVRGGHYPCLPLKSCVQSAHQKEVCRSFPGRLLGKQIQNEWGFFLLFWFILHTPFHPGPAWAVVCCTCITLGWILWASGLIGMGDRFRSSRMLWLNQDGAPAGSIRYEVQPLVDTGRTAPSKKPIKHK